LSAEPGCRAETTMSVCPSTGAQKSGEPTQASTSPLSLSSTTAAAWTTPRFRSMAIVCRTSDSISRCSSPSSDVRTLALVAAESFPVHAMTRVVKCGARNGGERRAATIGSSRARATSSRVV
jgi:hypothetical protein